MGAFIGKGYMICLTVQFILTSDLSFDHFADAHTDRIDALEKYMIDKPTIYNLHSDSV